MKNRFLFLCVFVLFLSGIQGQDSPSKYKLEFHIRPSAGVHIPITKLLQGNTTDYLLDYDDNRYYWQVVSLSLFFHKHWGLEFIYQASTSTRISKRADNFISSFQSEDEDFYVTPATGANMNDFNIFWGSVGSGYLGVIYRLETEHFYLYPKFSIGVTSFYSDWGGASIKEKNSNIEYRLTYSTQKKPNDHFTIAPSLSLGWKISKRIHFNIDVMISYYRTNITFEKELLNLYTKERDIETIDYRKDIFNMGLGAGLVFVIN